jgi:DNA helicase-2/ATP-dependent DNA helicase PcrA
MRHVMAQRRRRNFLEQRSYLRGIFVMTLHQSQGKQFDAVFIWRCNDGIIPHPEEIRKGDTSPSQHLLYVGITRARHLVRIYYEQNNNAQPSRLIQAFIVAR